MVIRLQGFDSGVFGGNYHTHNSIPLPPGLDVVVYSNGVDWVRGFRNAIHKVDSPFPPPYHTTLSACVS